MTGNHGGDEELGSVKHFLRPYVSLGLMFVLPYVITGAIAAAVVAYAFPKAFAAVAIVLVVIFVTVFVKLLRWRRKVQHRLIARRADKQNTAYIRGKIRAEEVMRENPGKYRPEDLDRLFGVDGAVHGKYRPKKLR